MRWIKGVLVLACLPIAIPLFFIGGILYFMPLTAYETYEEIKKRGFK
jgi:hypothetical protein